MVLIILLVFLSLSLLVFFHEFGHFIFSKIFSVRVEEFGLGYAPRLAGLVKIDKKWKLFFGKKIPLGEKAGTIYSLNWIPFGGFNKIKSEFGEKSGDKDSFSNRSWWQKSIIALGGVVFNVVLTLVLLTFVFTLGSYQILPDEIFLPTKSVQDISLQIVEVIKNSPADQAGLKSGDKIIAVDGKGVSVISYFQNYVKDKINIPIRLSIQRQAQHLEVEVKTAPAEEIFKDQKMAGAAIGISLVRVGKISYSPPVAFWQAIKRTGALFYQIIITIARIFVDLFKGQKVALEVVGVVGLAALTGKVAQMGIIYLLQFLATISVLIAFTQLIPFPAIDGGRIIFFIIEAIRKKPINYKIEAAINNIGFILLIIFMLFITYRDITRLSSGFFEKILSP